MSYCICNVPCSNMKASDSHQSETVSQILFGEYCIMANRNDSSWVKIKCEYDGYEGWIPESHLDYGFDLFTPEYRLTKEVTSLIKFDGLDMLLPIGCNVHLPEKFISDHDIQLPENYEPVSKALDASALIEMGMKYINTTYHWGGRTNFGIDCSGFVQMIFKFFNTVLPRDAYQQAEKGRDIGFLADVNPGDLAFFDNDAGRITHVGVLLNDHEVLHASGKVRIDKIDSNGIINSTSQKRTHRLRMIKRIF